jgi:photosystem II stability/assembly factor-like uncharacterized protein
LYAAVRSAGILKTTDLGATWVHLAANLPGTDGLFVALDPADPETVYVSIEGGGVFKSSNGGMTWTPAGSGLLGVSQTLLIDPNNARTLYAGTTSVGSNISGAFRSTDAGTSWSPISSELVNPLVFDLKFDALDSQKVYVGMSGGVIQLQFGPGPAVHGVSFSPPKKLMITGADFGTSPRVLINNQDRSSFIKKTSSSAILLKRKPAKLGLVSGENVVRVIDDDGNQSNEARFVF